MALTVVACGQTDVGRRRDKNEDSFLMNSEHQLFVVADGMGGHVGGGLASRMAVASIEEVVKRLTTDPDSTLEEGWELRPGDYRRMLRYAIETASHRIFRKAQEDTSLKGMGTTTVAILVRDGTLYLANVGDSRCYLIRGGQIRQITTDHSLVGEQLRAGVLSEADARGHRLKNIITRSVGFQDLVEIDVDSKPLHVGEIYALSTDGLTNMVDDQEILSVVTHNTPKDACRQLIDLANERGGDDNISVLLLTVVNEEGSKNEHEHAADESEEPTIEL